MNCFICKRNNKRKKLISYNIDIIYVESQKEGNEYNENNKKSKVDREITRYSKETKNTKKYKRYRGKNINVNKKENKFDKNNV